MKENENGFSAIQALLTLVIFGLIGFVGWYVWHSKNNADRHLNTAANTSTTAPSTTKNQSSEPKENTVILKIGNYSLELEVPETLKDLAIGRSRDSSIQGKDFTEAVLATNEFQACEGRGGGVLGSIYKLNGKYDQYPIGVISDEGVYVKQLDSFYLMFQGPQSYDCGEGTLNASTVYSQVKQAIIDDGWVKKTK